MRILVVEDDGLIAMIVCETLMDAGHEIIGPAQTVRDALELARATQPDLALLDINLEGEMEGLHLARVLHASYHTPILFLSGTPYEAWAASDIAVGYVAKPCSPSALIECVEFAQAVAVGGAREEQPIPDDLTLFQTVPENSH